MVRDGWPPLESSDWSTFGERHAVRHVTQGGLQMDLQGTKLMWVQCHKRAIWEWFIHVYAIYVWWFGGWFMSVSPTRLLTIINHIITVNINHILTVYYQPMVGWNHQPSSSTPLRVTMVAVSYIGGLGVRKTSDPESVSKAIENQYFC